MAASSPWSQTVVRFLTSSGFSVHVVDFNSGVDPGVSQSHAQHTIAQLRRDGVDVHIVALPRFMPLRVLLGAWHMRRVARRWNAQLVLTLYGGTQAAIVWLSKIRPYTVYIVGSDVLLAHGLRIKMARAALRGAQTVLANGEHLAQRTRELVPGRPVHTQYLGINVNRFRPPQNPIRAAVFVCSRVFGAVYDNASIIRAVAQLSSVPDDFRVRFLSAGPLLGEAEALAATILGAGRRDRVVFERGVSDEDLQTALESSAFYISASHSDGSSASLLEAFASGLFPIVSDIPANREWVVHGKNGLLFPPGDVTALAACMSRAIAGIDFRDAAVQANQRLVKERGDMTTNLHRLSDLLRTGAA